MCQSDLGANANARAVEVEPDKPEEECREIQHVWATSVCNNSDTPSVESGNLFSMLMDSGTELWRQLVPGLCVQPRNL